MQSEIRYAELLLEYIRLEKTHDDHMSICNSQIDDKLVRQKYTINKLTSQLAIQKAMNKELLGRIQSIEKAENDEYEFIVLSQHEQNKLKEIPAKQLRLQQEICRLNEVLEHYQSHIDDLTRQLEVAKQLRQKDQFQLSLWETDVVKKQKIIFSIENDLKFFKDSYFKTLGQYANLTRYFDELKKELYYFKQRVKEKCLLIKDRQQIAESIWQCVQGFAHFISTRLDELEAD